MEAVICVFAKPPIAGEVKTRLGLPPLLAARLAQAFLDDTLSAMAALPWATVALASTAPATAAVPVLLQGEGDLGARIERVLRAALALGAAGAPARLSSSPELAWDPNHSPAMRRPAAVIAIGADAPALPARLLESARTALHKYDAVLGPADDGGFYLLALRACPPGLLDGLPWSAPQTCARTLLRLRERGYRTALLEPWFDVDRPEDLTRLEALLRAGTLSAPRTKAVLAEVRAAELSVAERAAELRAAELRAAGSQAADLLPAGRQTARAEPGAGAERPR